MLHIRLREIRKAKGLTLQQVAERVRPTPTTAQTIGRLETGMRTLSIEWVEKIAAALEVDPAELLALPEGGDLMVSGAVSADGSVRDAAKQVVAWRLAARSPIAVRIVEALGQYRPGDTVVCNRLDAGEMVRAIGTDGLAEDTSGRRYFAKILAGGGPGRFTLAPLAPVGRVLQDVPLSSVAPAVMLVRQLAP